MRRALRRVAVWPCLFGVLLPGCGATDPTGTSKTTGTAVTASPTTYTEKDLDCPSQMGGGGAYDYGLPPPRGADTPEEAAESEARPGQTATVYRRTARHAWTVIADPNGDLRQLVEMHNPGRGWLVTEFISC